MKFIIIYYYKTIDFSVENYCGANLIRPPIEGTRVFYR